jgi:RNA polymerase sigma-70 factor (ECF subfamily)
LRDAGQSDDARDVRRAAAGDLAAFERLYRRHAARVYSLARRMLRREDRAEELTQEVFLRAWRECASYRGEAPFGAWLARLARNLVLNELRQNGRHLPDNLQGARGDEESESWPAVAGEEPGAGTFAPGRAAELGPEEGLDLEAAIGSLPEGARQVLVLYHFEGFTHQEIAQALTITAGTSKSQLHRARALLREALAPKT